MTDVVSLPITDWNHRAAEQQQALALDTLEQGNVLLLPHLSFALGDGEHQLLLPTIAGASKNISLAASREKARGSSAADAQLIQLTAMMSRFADNSRVLIGNLLPQYDSQLLWERTSFRPLEIAGRPTSWRKDDTRLHIDSFPSSPCQGKRILRVFSNVNPSGRSRTWLLGEGFENVAKRYLRFLPDPVWGANYLLHALGITKSRRSAYDHFMLHLHDRMKADSAYQLEVNQSVYEFPAGSTWIVFTDQVSHAATAGQHAVEQTFLLPVDAMSNPEQSPLRVLERFLGRSLI